MTYPPENWDDAVLRLGARGHRMHNVYLPGDRAWYEEMLRDIAIKRAQLRDAHLNVDEQCVRDCVYVQLRHSMWCRHVECRSCPWLTRSA